MERSAFVQDTVETAYVDLVLEQTLPGGALGLDRSRQGDNDWMMPVGNGVA